MMTTTKCTKYFVNFKFDRKHINKKEKKIRVVHDYNL